MGDYRISLENLALKPYIVLLDTNVFLDYYGNKINHKSLTLSEKFAQIEERSNFFVLMKDYVKNKSNFYITPLVSDEIQAGYAPSIKKTIKKIGCSEDYELLDLHRKRRSSSKEQRNLGEVFQDNDKIIKLGKEKQILYDLFYNRNIGLKEKYGLSEPDFDFLISGVVLAKTNGVIALVSNDKGIFRARGDLLKNERIWYKKVKFFVRQDFLGFKKMSG